MRVEEEGLVGMGAPKTLWKNKSRKSREGIIVLVTDDWEKMESRQEEYRQTGGVERR